MAFLASGEGIKVVSAESNSQVSNQVKEVAQSMRLPESDIPALPEAVSHPGGSTSSENIQELWPHLSEAMEKHFEERNHPSTQATEKPSSSRRDQGIPLKKKVRVRLANSRSREMTSRGEIPSSTMETHQGEQDKGREPLSSNGEMDALAKRAQTDPKVRERMRKLFAESGPLSEQKNATSVPERRRLDYPDNQCLDISQTQVYSNGVRNNVNPPGDSLEVDIQGVLQNNCDSEVSGVKYNIGVQLSCPSGSYDPGKSESLYFEPDSPNASFPKGGPYSVTQLPIWWEYACYVGGDGENGVQSAVVPDAVEVQGFATGVDANANAVQSQNIDVTVYKPS